MHQFNSDFTPCIDRFANEISFLYSSATLLLSRFFLKYTGGPCSVYVFLCSIYNMTFYPFSLRCTVFYCALPHKQVLTGSKDRNVCLSRIASDGSGGGSIRPERVFEMHSGVVKAVSWQPAEISTANTPGHFITK
jgi:WD40 repeat protein